MSEILFVDDDEEFANECLAQLYANGFSVDYCANALDAFSKIRTNEYSVALLDLMLPPTFKDEGLQIQKWLMEIRPGTPIIFIIARTKKMIPIVTEAMKNGAKDFIPKNEPDTIPNVILKIFEVVMQENKRIFISHGYNELIELKTKDFIERRLGIPTIVLGDQPSQGLTIVEKLEKATKQCSFAVILMTKDDEQKNDSARARPNVVHELGFSQGRFGRKNVVLIAERGVELFSNISGIVRIDFERDHFEHVFDPLRLEIEGSALFTTTV
jgi:predicted nucleotide-binding protein